MAYFIYFLSLPVLFGVKEIVVKFNVIEAFHKCVFLRVFFIYIFCWGIVALQCCVGFCVQQNESAVYIYSCIYIDI